jgi:alginate O-acetyltransferase complex protein AlgJ
MPNSELDTPLTDLAAWRRRYAQILATGVTVVLLFVMMQSLGGGIENLDTQLWGRTSLVELFTRIRLKLHDRVFPSAVVGADGWLEYTAEHNLDDYQNVIPFSPKSIRSHAMLLYNNLRARHITLLIVIAPNKATIYPGSVPAEIGKINEQSRLDLLAAYMKRYGPPVFLDLRPGLEAASKAQTIYYKTDTHWNALGAYAAYTEIMDALSPAYPQLKTIPLNNFRLRTGKPSQKDLARIIGAPLLEPSLDLSLKHEQADTLPSALNDDLIPSRIAVSANTNAPSLLMYYDSFGDGLVPMLAPSFGRSTFVYDFSPLHDLVSYKLVNQLQPDVVIIEFVERYIDELDGLLAHYGVQTPTQ